MGEERPMVVLKERVILKKYDGDPPADGEEKVPVEEIVLEDGEIIARHVLLPQEGA